MNQNVLKNLVNITTLTIINCVYALTVNLIFMSLNLSVTVLFFPLFYLSKQNSFFYLYINRTELGIFGTNLIFVINIKNGDYTENW